MVAGDRCLHRLHGLTCVSTGHTVRCVATKSERFAVRLTPEQDALIRRAAEVEGLGLTAFTLSATRSHARDVLADRRLVLLGDAAWAEFNALVDRLV